MSTASETARSPLLASRTRIHSGVLAAASRPCTSRSTNRSQAVGSAMLAGYTSGAALAAGPAASSAGPVPAGSVNSTPYALASSRATPRTDRA